MTFLNIVSEKPENQIEKIAVEQIYEQTEDGKIPVDKPRLKARFRPNLSENRAGEQQRAVRLRKTSGCESGIGSPGSVSVTRIRTISSGSNGSDAVANNSENEDVVVSQKQPTTNITVKMLICHHTWEK